ncbi:MAG: hypothetical protein V7K87_05895 [Nostoc sp.]
MLDDIKKAASDRSITASEFSQRGNQNRVGKTNNRQYAMHSDGRC